MSQRAAVLGFTEAELGFFIAFLVLAFALEPPPPPGDVVPADSLRQAQAQVASLERRMSELEALRSRQRPSCRERGIVEGFLFHAVVTPSGRYEVRGRQLDLSALYTTFAAEIATARQADCRHQVRISASSGLSADAFQTAVRNLARDFYYQAW